MCFLLRKTLAILCLPSNICSTPRRKQELLTEEVVELLTAPADLATYKAAITEALYKGTRRNIESEADPKNAVVG